MAFTTIIRCNRLAKIRKRQRLANKGSRVGGQWVDRRNIGSTAEPSAGRPNGRYDISAKVPIPSAQYLRRSTEHQQYSLDNQKATIAQFADQHSFSVVQTYTDARTGVVLGRRSGLRQLLQDVMSGHAAYKAILVYDVSRWGRFQDNDEGAHYEFVCRSAGIPVHYCAESFTNDGSTPSSLMKALKRSMAGEYSRELGVKVLAGQKRLAELGFKQGGMPRYGLRRLLVSANREPRHGLSFGERKSIATDRVVLVPGPENEVQQVRDIYRMLIVEKRNVHGLRAS